MSRHPCTNFRGQTAIVLPRSDGMQRRLTQRLTILGIGARSRRDRMEASDTDADVLILDMVHDDQLPWPAGQARIPTVGLVGWESPGRLDWALAQEIDAYLPLSALGTIFSTLVIAHETFGRCADNRQREVRTSQRASGRLDVIWAVLSLMEAGSGETVALKQLRAFAMVEHLTLEDAAVRLLTERLATRQSGR